MVRAVESLEPYWEREREPLFSALDYSSIETPAYLIHLGALEENLKLLQRVKERAGCKVLLALKAYAAWKSFPLIGKYLDGVSASSVYEARLGREEFGKEVHTFSPAYTERDIEEHLLYSDQLIFNSFSLWRRYRDAIFRHNAKEKRQIACGIRVNPELRRGALSALPLYDPCSHGSRLGVPLRAFRENEGELKGISTLHFHALFEEGADALEELITHLESELGPYLPRFRWINMGGGHLITRRDYDIDRLCALIHAFKENYGVGVILEPGEAVALNAGVLVASVLDIIDNGGLIALLDTTAEGHMPDVLATPYTPSPVGAAKAGVKRHTYRLGGLTCLAGDFIGSYSFDKELRVGDKVVFQNMAPYTIVKNNSFNGMRLPHIFIMDGEGRILHRKSFGYQEYKNRLC